MLYSEQAFKLRTSIYHLFLCCFLLNRRRYSAMHIHFSISHFSALLLPISLLLAIAPCDLGQSIGDGGPARSAWSPNTDSSREEANRTTRATRATVRWPDSKINQRLFHPICLHVQFLIHDILEKVSYEGLIGDFVSKKCQTD